MDRSVDEGAAPAKSHQMQTSLLESLQQTMLVCARQRAHFAWLSQTPVI